VPDFLQEAEPEVALNHLPPTPGETWNDVGDAILTDAYLDEEEALTEFDETHDERFPVDQMSTTSTSIVASNFNNSEQSDQVQEKAQKKGPILSHVLRGLDNDTKFLHDALQQINTLKVSVEAHDRHCERVKEWLDNNTVACDNHSLLECPITKPQPATTEAQKEKPKEIATRYLKAAKAYDAAAEKAEAEASKYRQKAKQLLENALMEVEIFGSVEFLGEEDGSDED
jgi:cytochrome c biogenesis protein ResB